MKSAALLAIWLSVGAVMSSQTASAHHSAAMYDANKVVTLKGKLRKVQISNPHSWLWVAVPKDGGEDEVWAVESHGASEFLKRNGPTAKRDLGPGEEVTVKIHPLRDGRHSGSLVQIILKNGKVFD